MTNASNTPSNSAVNCVKVGARVAAICQCCGKRSKPTKPAEDGEPREWEMGRGWGCAPYPKDFKHEDGSTGSTWTCPQCNKRLHAGETLRTRGGFIRAVR